MPTLKRKLTDLLTSFTAELATSAGIVAAGAAAAVSLTSYPRAFDPWVLLLPAMAFSLLAAVSSIAAVRFQRRRMTSKNVFLVYANEDRDAARSIANLLKENGYKPWLDADQILPGQLWRDEIDAALSRSSVAVVIVSKNFEGSQAAQDELTKALKTLRSPNAESTPIIPVKLDESFIPGPLQDIQWAQYGTDDWQARFLAGLKSATSTPM